MQQSIRLSFSLTGMAALASLPQAMAEPAPAAQASAVDLGVMSVSLSDVVKPQLGIQGQTQGAGTPNQAGVGGFLPLMIGENSVLFLDALANVNFSDFSGYSSIINTTVAGITISTSSRLGYRWLNGDRSWMFGINGGYDTRPMATGNADTGVAVTNKNSVFFQQAAFGIEAVSDHWNLNAYGLIPTGTTNYQLNSVYQGAALETYGVDAGYNITPQWMLSAGYYYQSSDLGAADGSGVQGRLAYNINENITIGGNYSYDDAFDSRVSADIKLRFNAAPVIQDEKQKKAWQKPVIVGLTQALKNRTVRVHDVTSIIATGPEGKPCNPQPHRASTNDRANETWKNGNEYSCRKTVFGAQYAWTAIPFQKTTTPGQGS